MKTRWLLIALLLAFPFAFAFFLREARLGEKRKAKPTLVVPSAPASTPATASEISPAGPLSPMGPIAKTPSPEASTTASSTPEPAKSSPLSAKPVLLQGTFAKEDGSLIYDADAKLRLAQDVILSSPTGVMVSNEKQTLFAGDMQIEAGKNTITAHEGVLDTNANQMKATVASISFTNENNQLVRMTGENVTLELPTSEKSQTNTVVADSVTVESKTAAAASTPPP